MKHSLVHQIEETCKTRGVRLTPQRKIIFELIYDNNKSTSAYELLDALKKTMPTAKPPIIYRALDFLMAQGFIHKVESSNCFVVCSHLQKEAHFCQLLVCDNCKKVTEVDDESLLSMLKKNAKIYNFLPQTHVIESHGLCSLCRQDR